MVDCRKSGLQMRSAAEVEQAHDLLVSVLGRATPLRLDVVSEDLMHESADVLCWVLEHEPPHFPETFGEELFKLTRALAAAR